MITQKIPRDEILRWSEKRMGLTLVLSLLILTFICVIIIALYDKLVILPLDFDFEKLYQHHTWKFKEFD